MLTGCNWDINIKCFSSHKKVCCFYVVHNKVEHFINPMDWKHMFASFRVLFCKFHERKWNICENITFSNFFSLQMLNINRHFFPIAYCRLPAYTVRKWTRKFNLQFEKNFSCFSDESQQNMTFCPNRKNWKKKKIKLVFQNGIFKRNIRFCQRVIFCRETCGVFGRTVFSRYLL